MLIVYFTFHYFIIYLLKMLYFLYNFINYQILWCISKNTFILCKSFSWLWVMFAILLTSFYWTNLLHIYSISDQFQRRNIDDWTNAFQYARKKILTCYEQPVQMERVSQLILSWGFAYCLYITCLHYSGLGFIPLFFSFFFFLFFNLLKLLYFVLKEG